MTLTYEYSGQVIKKKKTTHYERNCKEEQRIRKSDPEWQIQTEKFVKNVHGRRWAAKGK